MIILTILIINVLLVASGLCSAIETAFTAASPAKIHKIKSQGNKNGQVSLDLIKIKEKVISTFLILYSILNTFATTIATGFFISIFGEDTGTLISSLVMATLIIIFAEVIPKAIAVAKPEILVVSTANVVKRCLILMNPINLSLSQLVRGFCFVFRINLAQNFSAVEEVKDIIQHHHVEGNVHKIDRDILDRVLDISQMCVDEVMIHRSKIISLSYNLPIKQIIEQALSCKHTKIPLWKDNTDNIVGVLDIKKLILMLHKNNFVYSEISLKEAISDPWFIPETALVSQQLQNFRNRSDQIAFIVDEYGDLQGMVTLKDVIDEIVGHIHDEHIHLQHLIRKIGNKYVIDGSTAVREINRELDWKLPEEEANTIAGLITHYVGAIPEKGDEFKMFGLKMTIRKKTANKIITVLAQLDELENNTYNEHIS
jgi:Mg2+/Co2+ transporter CorB